MIFFCIPWLVKGKFIIQRLKPGIAQRWYGEPSGVSFAIYSAVSPDEQEVNDSNRFDKCVCCSAAYDHWKPFGMDMVEYGCDANCQWPWLFFNRPTLLLMCAGIDRALSMMVFSGALVVVESVWFFTPPRDRQTDSEPASRADTVGNDNENTTGLNGQLRHGKLSR